MPCSSPQQQHRELACLTGFFFTATKKTPCLLHRGKKLKFYVLSFVFATPSASLLSPGVPYSGSFNLFPTPSAALLPPGLLSSWDWKASPRTFHFSSWEDCWKVLVGIISYMVPVYIAEIAPQHLRGALGFVNQLSVTIGILLSYLLGLLVDWRLLAVIGILPCLILIPALFFISESPQWLVKMGMTDDFKASLQVLRDFDTDITLERSVASMSRRTTLHFVEIKSRRYWLPLIIGIELLILQHLRGINGVFFYSFNIFESAGIIFWHG